MRWQFNPKFRAVIFAILILGGTMSARAITQEVAQEGRVDIPPPPKSKLLDTKEMTLGGRKLQGTSYLSEENEYVLAHYYQEFFRRQGFNQLLDQYIQKTTYRQLKFKRETETAEVFFVPKKEGIEVSVVEYLEPKGVPAKGDWKFSPQDLAPFSPKEDQPGEDLAIIPRPAKSVRWLSKEQGKKTHLLYVSPLSIKEARDFYKSQMEQKGWQFQKEVSTADALRLYKKNTGKSVSLPSFMQGGGDLNQALAESCSLYFNYGQDKVEVVLFPNFLNNEGSMAQIFYERGE